MATFQIAKKGECRDDINGSMCMTSNALEIVKSSFKVPNLTQAKEITKCDTESCILDKIKHKNPIINEELKTRFKPIGPHSNEWLDNFNVDETLRLWSIEPQFSHFYNCKFSMANFKKYGEELGTINLKNLYEGNNKRNKKFKTFGCIVNTDYHPGPGKHWVALFVDMRISPFSIEYFNSSGSPPLYEYADWMHKGVKDLQPHKAIINIPNKIVHQKKRTECGVYGLYYIRARLNGIDAEYFNKLRVTDEDMLEFRKYLFRKA